MKSPFILLACAAVLAGCGKNSNQGGTGGNDNPPVTGRGSGGGGNGKVYDRGGEPASPSPTRQRPGSGRIDQGGGQTSGGKLDNSVPPNSNGIPQGTRGR